MAPFLRGSGFAPTEHPQRSSPIPKCLGPLPDRRLTVAVVLLLVAVPMAGCADITNASRDGYGETWGAKLVQADKLHERGLTGEGVKVAIIDTGIDLSHPEFKGKDIQWADLVNHEKTAYDDHGHGTHVAGIVAAQGTWSTLLSGFRLGGVAPDVDLIVIKAMDKDGNGEESRVANGINTAVSAGADVIILSLGGKTRAIFGTNTENAVKSAIAKGVFVVAAAGNADKDRGESTCTITSPASVEGVIAVGAVDKDEVLGDFSCHGTGDEGSGSVLPGVPSPVTRSRPPHQKPEVVAPGVDVLSTWDREQADYALATGTSQAAPYVGGILALILQEHPELKRQDQATVFDLKSKLMVTSKKIGPLEGKSSTAHDDAYGYGLVQGDALLRALG